MQSDSYNFRVARFGSVRFRFVHETVQAVPIFGSDGSSLEKGVSVSTLLFYQKGMDNGSDGSGSSFSFWKNGSDGSGFRFRFGSWAIL